MSNRVSIDDKMRRAATPFDFVERHLVSADRVREYNIMGDRTGSSIVFDPRRTAILLIGGEKTGDDRFYETLIRQADDLYDQHLDTLKREALDDG